LDGAHPGPPEGDEAVRRVEGWNLGRPAVLAG
jgi:hypothetical protein